MKRVLITGAGGYVGKYLAAQLAGLCEVATLDLATASVTHPCDIRDADATAKAIGSFRPDAVIHCAAMSKIGECEQRPNDCFAVNVAGAENVVRASIESGAKLVVGLSSDRVFQADANRYGHSKAEMERLFTGGAVDSKGTALVVLRLGKVIGSPGGFLDCWKSAFIRTGVIESTGPEHHSFYIELEGLLAHVRHLLENAQGWNGQVYVPEQKALRMRDVLDVWVDAMGGEWKDTSDQSRAIESGTMISADEMQRACYEHGAGTSYFRLNAQSKPSGESQALTTADAKAPSRAELLAMLQAHGAEPFVQRPRQAVILAGGRGTRLAPITDTLPKPMIAFHGVPFLAYIIEHLREQGFERILLLLGYRAEQIQAHFGDGADFGVAIEYSVTDESHDTGERLRLVRDRVDPLFLLLYCDNYWPMPFAAMWEQFASFAKGEVKAQVVVYRNLDGYTRNNLIVDANHRVTLYDKSRTAANLAGVDIGFFLLHKEVLQLLPEGNVSLEKFLYPRLICDRQLAAFLTDHRYYSVGSHERLPLTENFLRRERTVLLDRDGVLNAKAPRGKYICSWDDWQWLPGSLEALALLHAEGFRVLVISNQAGIARGHMTHADLEAIHDRAREDIAKHGANIEHFYVCPHGWDDDCVCRKPKPGMLLQAQRDYDLDLSRVFFVGDDPRDIEAGEAARCRTLLVTEERTLLDVVRDEILPSSAFGRYEL